MEPLIVIIQLKGPFSSLSTYSGCVSSIVRKTPRTIKCNHVCIPILIVKAVNAAHTEKNIFGIFGLFVSIYASICGKRYRDFFFPLRPGGCVSLSAFVVEEVFNHRMRMMVLFPTHKNQQHIFVVLSACRHSTVTDNL